jgi:Tfp pilus assembly protein PilN
MTTLRHAACGASTLLGRALHGWRADLAWWLEPLLRRAMPDHRPVAVALPAGDVFRLTLHLPAASLPHLHEAVRYRLLTESPLPIDALAFDARVREPAADAGPRGDDTCIDVVLCRRDRLMQRVAEQGSATGALTIGWSADGTVPFDFVLFSRHGGLLAGAGRGSRLWLGSLGAMACLALPAACATARIAEQRVQQEIRSFRHTAGDVVRRQEQLERLVRMAGEIRGALPGSDPVRLIDELAAHLPSTAWVDRLHQEHDRLVLHCRGADPGASVAALARSPLLARATLVSVTAAPSAGEPVAFQVAAPLTVAAAR